MSFSEYLAERWPRILQMTAEHAEVVLIAVAVAAVLGIGLGIAVQGRPRASQVALGVAGTMLTVPSLALFGLLIPLFGLGLAPTITALALYAVFPILRNTITGLESVPGAVEEAARGMGLGAAGWLVRVRLPLAWPVVLTGVRVATIMTVAIAAIAAAVAGPGLGELIFQGLARIGGANALNDTVAGTLGVALLALLLDLAFVLLARLTTSKGLR
ncbi:ABC transporter permease [Actinomadura macrotermitis]|uniref:Glycine betaine/carnitine/choline transport system permease protein OpuCB n=1 Tax=Actinomadura macrotermitis TaxID=2585200 RepID=A0A7K0C3W6_9ACTN|nr:ABC transporter permease [Actinomadura macrotermitis]MQY07792.1 Glycine betaine/carnitine/choline transport system permease protein OpuCB [Actinomadura macrotermitis]